MAEYEVNAHLEDEIDIEVGLKALTIRQKLRVCITVLLGGKLIFPDYPVELEGECYVEIEPQERE